MERRRYNTAHRIRRLRGTALVAAGALAAAALAGPTAYGASAGSAVSPGVTTGVRLAATCSETSSGKADCAKAPTAKLPAASTDKAPAAASSTTSLADTVDTRTWTTDGGNTFPGADVPYGMVQWSPDTMPDRNDGGGYSYGDSELTGYSLTHMSGPGCSGAGDVPILPMTGALPSGDPTNVTTEFTNTGEVAQAGYYSAENNLPQTITSQFTATTHSAMGDFTFPKTTAADFLVKLMDSQNPDTASSAQVVGTDELEGSDTSGGFCGYPQPYTVFFDIVFNQPFTASQIITESGATSPDAAFLTFNTSTNQTIEAKVGISYVSAANAKLDWQTENSGWNFSSVKSAAQKTWNTLLGKVQVSGGTVAQTQQFYSNLYKLQVQPNVTSDVNGQFMGSDNKVHTVASPQTSQYGMFSGWDTYHAVAQLQAIFDPAAASDMAQSQVNYYAENGVMQQWGYLNLDNYVMVGDPEDAIISDVYAFGAKNFDTAAALVDMVKQATTVNTIRPGEALEAQDGYLPQDGTYGCCGARGEVSTLLEYDSADFALSQYAAALGDTPDATMLENRANNWANEFDSSTGLLTPRLTNGSFVAGVGPTSSSAYVEGDAYEYLWDVPNDYAGLISLLGGNSTVAPELEQYLAQPDGGGMNAYLANEFDNGEQNAPDYAGDPSGTQQAVNNIRNSLYTPGPTGLLNNDDLGAMSAQFVWEMLGMYPENPGSGNLVFASPGFPKESITLANGKTISITAPNASPTEFYVKSLKINGKADNSLYVPFSTLENGGTLAWTLSTQPTSWGAAAADAPPSYGPVYSDTASVSPSAQTLAPGASASTTLSVQSTNTTAQTVTWTAATTSGVTVSPASGTLSVAADGSASTPVTVTAGSTDGDDAVTFNLTSTGGSILPVQQSVIVDTPGDIGPYDTVIGISDDASPTSADFDGDGFSYSQEALTAAGLSPGATVTSGGLTYTWPNIPAGQVDALQSSGQTIAVDAPAGSTSIGFLGSSVNAGSAGEQGTVTVNYTDGTSSTQTLGFTDWTEGGGGGSVLFGNTPVATLPYRNGASGQQQISTFVFAQTIPVDGTKTVASITLPVSTDGGNLNIFSIAAG